MIVFVSVVLAFLLAPQLCAAATEAPALVGTGEDHLLALVEHQQPLSPREPLEETKVADALEETKVADVPQEQEDPSSGPDSKILTGVAELERFLPSQDHVEQQGVNVNDLRHDPFLQPQPGPSALDHRPVSSDLRDAALHFLCTQRDELIRRVVLGRTNGQNFSEWFVASFAHTICTSVVP